MGKHQNSRLRNDSFLTKRKRFGSLIVASNRLPFTISFDENGVASRENSAGGLVTAVAPVVMKLNGYWIGWAGRELLEGMEIPESTDPTSISHSLKSSQLIPVYYNDELYNNFYNGMCNASLWPIMHSLPTKAVFRTEYWNAYVEVNKTFASEAYEILKKSNVNNSLTWIHDYHLLMMPIMLKNLIDEASLSSKIGFFLHIPFPSWDIFRLIPWSNEILSGMLGSDLIAFHTHTYAMNFIECCAKILGSRIDRKEMLIEYGNKIIVVRAFPLGIPYDWFSTMSKESPKILTNREKIILGVDRLDYTKGILERLRGYERFLDKYPDFKTKVVFLQIAVPSRTDIDCYKALKDDLEREIGRICGKFGTSDWTPIKYICKNLSQFELTGYYRDSAIALITPIRDGMNLVAKEYVACQTDDPGVLILSPFTGAGETMSEALTVNPLEEDMLADTIKKALDMSYHERKLRMNALQNREKIFNLDSWLDSFFEACDLLDNTTTKQMQSITLEDFDSWLNRNVRGYKLSIILDYDGTLVPLSQHPDLAVLPADTKDLLEKLVSFPNVDLSIISERSLENLKQMVEIPNLNFAGSHGLEIQLANQDREESYEQAAFFKSKVSEVANDLRKQVCQHGGWVEEKVFHATFHWRDTAESYKQIMIQKAREIIQSHGFQPQNVYYGIEAKPPIGWDKGRGVYCILERLYGVTWANNVRAIYIGDDESDEDVMRALAGLGITFKIGKPNEKTFASHRLSNTLSVKVFLEWAIKYMNDRMNPNRRQSKRLNQGLIKMDH